MDIMIAEDSGLLRQMLTELLTSHGLQITGSVSTTEELLHLIAATPPDVVVLDIRMPPTYRDEGLRTAIAIRSQYPNIGLLILSHYAETSYAVTLLEHASRAVGYLVKDQVQDVHRLIEALTRVAAGEVVIDSEIVQRMMRRRRVNDPLANLTPSERQVLALIAEGRSNSAIAETLHYSHKTVEKRITTLCRKLGLTDPTNANRADVNIRVLAVLIYLRTTNTIPRPTDTNHESPGRFVD
jgi:DNA-binding NarL/FixJ family response regulator